MHGLVKIRGLNTLYRLKELPEDRDELDLVVEGGTVFIPPDIVAWPEGMDEDDRPPLTLGRCRADEKQYRLFKYPEEVEPAGFEPTELSFGGTYTPEMWRQMVKRIPARRAFAAIPPDPPGVWEKAMEYIRENH